MSKHIAPWVDQVREENERLRQENERLRAALLEISYGHYQVYAGNGDVLVESYSEEQLQDIAAKALKEVLNDTE